MSPLDDARLGIRTARALAGAGVLRPLSPKKALRVAGAARRFGTSAAAAVAIGAARNPDGIAIVDDAGVLTWSALDARATAIAGALAHEHRIGPGRPLAVMCRNHRGFVEALVAAAHLGADVLLINTEFPGPQLAQVLAGRDVGAVVLDAEFDARFDAACHDGARVLGWHEAGSPELPTLDDLAAAGRRPENPPSRQGRVTILSSGTTGAPKGAGRAPSLRALLGPIVTMLEQLGLRSGQPVLVGPPLFHGFGLSFLMLGQFLGCPIVLQRRFEPGEALASIERDQVSCFVGVPVMLQRLLDASADGARETPALRAVVAAGAPLSPHLSTAFMDTFGDVVFNAYGSTETGFGAVASPADLRAAPGTIGRPPLGTTLRVLGADRGPVQAGAVGHIFIGGELVFDGYEEGGSKEIVDGLMNTGDLGHMDAAGRVFVDGREDDMIVSGGENVFPQEVEETLAGHPDVADVTVIGVPDAEFGQRLKAFVVPSGAGARPDDELLAYVREHLARYKTPREIEFVSEIPRNPTGKVLRRELA